MGEEVLFSCSGGVGNSGVKIAVWEPSKGTVKRTYSCEAHGGGAALAVLGKTYLLCALKRLPFIYVWHLRKEQVHMKMSCSGVVRTLATTPNGVYCAAAIAEKIHIWEVSTGHLLAVVSQHYQPLSTLVFSDDGLWLVSGGEDGRVIVWSLRRILSESFDTSGVTLPHCEHVSVAVGPHPPAVHQLWSDHALPVTGICCGAGEGIQARVATASLDQTCKGIQLYEMASGRLLCSLLFGFSLTAVTMDTTEQWLFVGGATGRIAQVNLFLQRTSPAHDMANGVQSQEQFLGHTQAVRSLSVCCSGPSLVSSSEDGTCRVWDIASGQTIRVQQFKGSVVDSVLCWDTPIPGAGKKGGVSKDPPVSIAPFQKQLVYSKEGGGLEDVQITLRRTMDPLADLATLDCEAGLSLGHLPSSSLLGEEVEGDDGKVMDVHRLREDLTQLKEINRKLYSLLAEKSSPSQTATSHRH